MRLFSFDPPEKQEGAVLLKNGQNVSLYVRSVNADGTARIQVAGADIVARSEMPQGFSLQAGSILKGNVFFEDGRVCIRVADSSLPSAFSFSSFLASSGISPSEAALHALSFFYVSGMRIEPSALRRVLSLAAAFPGKEARAAEAAALLLQKGIPLSEKSVKAAIDALEGRLPAGAFSENVTTASEGVLQVNPDGGGGRQSTEQKRSGGGKRGGAEAEGGEEAACGDEESRADIDFFSAFAGASKAGEGSSPSWFILPYKRSFGGAECTGSIRFLASGLGGKAIETRITAVFSPLENTDAFSADFILSESECRFVFNPAPSGQAAARLSDELSRMLKGEGLPLPVQCGFDPSAFEAKSVNIEV